MASNSYLGKIRQAASAKQSIPAVKAQSSMHDELGLYLSKVTCHVAVLHIIEGQDMLNKPKLSKI